jgi:hypothetical protein
MKAILLLLVWCAAAQISAIAADKSDKEKTAAEARWRRMMEGPHVKRGILPELKLQRSISASAEEAEQIKRLIANLAKIERPDFGLSGTMDGTAFAPIAGSGKPTGGFLLTNHQLQTADDFRQLVAFGPRALPFLLEALDDKTPTKLKQNHGGGFGGMFLCTEMGSNPTNSIEQKAVASLPKREIGFSDGRTITDYTVTVGDVCFVAIGQIVGRAYLAVRYQPTAIIVINSPVEEKALAKAVRDIWSSTNAAQRLFDSLLFDYATEGVFNGESLDGWEIGNNLQCQAALRMLYYFPQETAELIAERLARLDVHGREGGVINFIRREVTNGVRAEEFVKAVAWSDEPAIRREVLNIFKRTTDSQILLAALPGIDAIGSDIVQKRLNAMIDQLPADESGPYGQGYNLLVALGEKLGAEAKPTFIRYLQKASLQRWRSMAQVLRKTRSEWAVELLSPALADKREFGWTYALTPGQNEPRQPIRVCDEVAETISLSRPDLQFKMAGEYEELDRQIAVILARIKSERP